MMKLLLFNTLTKRKEVFTPLDPHSVKMYVCGPTVYDNPHIGNARSAVIYDILYRMLIKLYGRSNILYVRNITDVDDKIIDKALKLDISISKLTEKVIYSYKKDMKYLGCLKPTQQPRATKYIPQMITAIQKLLDLGYAYKSNQHIYFDVSKAKNYMILCGSNIKHNREGVRILNDPNKKNPEDFILWKPCNEEESQSSQFMSPFGLGRPGWHIECSVMSNIFLGSNFDIHGGGIDLIFPHHTNELAQSCSLFPGSEYARYWMHNGFLTVNSEKMSKSTGNIIKVEDIKSDKIKGDIVRLFLISAHYHKPLDYNKKILNDSEKILNYWYRIAEELNLNIKTLPSADFKSDFSRNFFKSLLDNLNTPLAIKLINDLAKECYRSNNHETKTILAQEMICCAQFLGLMRLDKQTWFDYKLSKKYISRLIEKRLHAKEEKNWQLADQIRNNLYQAGVIIEDQPNGTSIWKRSINKDKVS